MGSESTLAQDWVDDPPPQSRCPYGPGSVEAVTPPPCPPCSVLHSEPLARSPELVCPRLTAALRSEWIPPALSQFPWHATSQDTEQLSPDKTVRGRCTSATLTRSRGSPDFAVWCQLVRGTRACSVVRVPRLAPPSPASFRPHLAVTPLPLTRSYPHGMLSP